MLVWKAMGVVWYVAGRRRRNTALFENSIKTNKIKRERACWSAQNKIGFLPHGVQFKGINGLSLAFLLKNGNEQKKKRNERNPNQSKRPSKTPVNDIPICVELSGSCLSNESNCQVQITSFGHCSCCGLCHVCEMCGYLSMYYRTICYA